MSMTKFESTVREIHYPQQNVYNKLSDLSNMEHIKELMPELKNNMSEQERQMLNKVNNLRCDRDTLILNVPPVGDISLRIIERDEPKCIKFETVQSPLPLNLWIQILPVTSLSSKMKLTIGGDINPFLKQMIKKPLQTNLEKVADLLQTLRYE